MNYKLEDNKTYKTVYLKDFPEGHELYLWYSETCSNIGNKEEVVFTPIDTIPYGAKVYKFLD